MRVSSRDKQINNAEHSGEVSPTVTKKLKANKPQLRLDMRGKPKDKENRLGLVSGITTYRKGRNSRMSNEVKSALAVRKALSNLKSEAKGSHRNSD